MANKINLVSAALVLIGDTPINTLTGDERRQQVAAALYDNVVQNELSKHRWGFARKKAQLALTTEKPIDQEWRYIYQLPSDLVVLTKLYPNTRYQILGDKVYTNINTALHCDYIHNAPESDWPAYFAKTVEYALAIDFATSIRDNSTIQQNMAALYDTTARNARYQDSQQHPPTPIADRPFINVRY